MKYPKPSKMTPAMNGSRRPHTQNISGSGSVAELPTESSGREAALPAPAATSAAVSGPAAEGSAAANTVQKSRSDAAAAAAAAASALNGIKAWGPPRAAPSAAISMR